MIQPKKYPRVTPKIEPHVDGEFELKNAYRKYEAASNPFLPEDTITYLRVEARSHLLRALHTSFGLEYFARAYKRATMNGDLSLNSVITIAKSLENYEGNYASGFQTNLKKHLLEEDIRKKDTAMDYFFQKTKT